jgi:hypothetical protein
MDFLLDALDEIAAQIFSSVAHLLNLDRSCSPQMVCRTC